MAKEIELKVLNINVEDIKDKLNKIGAVCILDCIQKIHTYDTFPISSSFLAIKDVLQKNIAPKENELAFKKLIDLLNDVADLLSDDDKKAMQKITKANSFQDFIKDLDLTNLNSVIFSQEFYNVINNYNTNPNKWVRLRETNGKTTITLKQIYNRKLVEGVRISSINDTKEIELEVESVEQGNLLLNELGYYHKNYQEKKRISYKLKNGAEIEIDHWPHIPPYLEVEAPTAQLVYETLEKLGFEEKDAICINTDDVYTLNGLDVYSFKELKFVA